jgi:uncharacterized protein YprB with RNaseH-like and TPR domain
MNFTDRLKLLATPIGAGASGPCTNRDERFDQRGAPSLDATSPIAMLIAPATTEHGDLYKRHEAFNTPLISTKPCADSLAALTLTAEFSALDTTRLLFLDTETTGLAGGTGTLAFVVGIATFSSRGVELEQALLPGPGQERPLLEWLRHRLEHASALVTFNGKSFDWPLLRNRYVMNRLKAPPELPHVDLVHVARRVYRWHLDEHRLGGLETSMLGVRRSNDIDGSEIPSVWFDYLRTRRVAELQRVLEHNARDVVSMAELLEVMSRSWRGDQPVDGTVALGLAQLAERLGDTTRALLFVRQSTKVRNLTTRSRALELEALLLRRRGEFDAAVERLEIAVTLAPGSPRLHLALARLYEHRMKNAPAAQRHAMQAGPAEPSAQHARRLLRLAERARREAEAPTLLPRTT